jgi:hypothetical protein
MSARSQKKAEQRFTEQHIDPFAAAIKLQGFEFIHRPGGD